MIYLDGAATSPLLPCAKKAILDVFDGNFGNPSSLHTPGHLAKNIIEDSRAKIARLINASPSEIFFTSGSTESNNTILHIFKNKNIAVSAIEHDSILAPARTYAKNLTILPVNKQGIVDKNLPKNINLFAISMSNGELGSTEDIKALTEVAHEQSALLSSDITASLGKQKIDVKSLDIDYAAFSAHKIGGPVGIGAIYVKSSAPFTPLILGGKQENAHRAGTTPTALIAGFAAAANFAYENRTWEIYEEKIRPLRDLLASEITKNIPFSIVNTPLNNSLPNILNVSFEAAEGESVQLYLDAHDIYVSTGSACASGEPSHVLLATTGSKETAHSSIRFSLSLNTTEDDIKKVISVLPNIVKKLQSISTITPKGIK